MSEPTSLVETNIYILAFLLYDKNKNLIVEHLIFVFFCVPSSGQTVRGLAHKCVTYRMLNFIGATVVAVEIVVVPAAVLDVVVACGGTWPELWMDYS